MHIPPKRDAVARNREGICLSLLRKAVQNKAVQNKAVQKKVGKCLRQSIQRISEALPPTMDR